MRINRIALRDFRGVSSLDIELDPTGVTVVEGRNEIGKTSIADAFMLLLDSKDSSSRREVRDVRPIGRDVGPFVEAELSVGRYRLTYRKRWLREKMTELDIVQPRGEQLTGEPAHSRMLEILRENTDPALFRALRYQQGVAISQATVGESPSLLRALDAAAGGSSVAGAGAQEALLDRVERERLRYFAEKGGVLAARRKKAERLGQLHDEVATVEEKIRDLDDAAERQNRIEAELGELNRKVPAAARQVNEHLATVQAIEQIERRVERSLHEHEQAQSALREADTARDAREKLIMSAESTAKMLAALNREIASNAPTLQSAQQDVAEAEQAHATAKRTVECAEEEASRAQRLLGLFERRFERDQLRERHERLAEAEEAIESAERFLAGCDIDGKLLGDIDDAAEKLAVARGRVEAGRPRLALEALRPIPITLDGEQIDALPGAPIERVLSGRIEARIGDLARLVVSVSDATGGAEKALAKARERLERLLGEAGVESQADAHEMARERSRHEARRESSIQRRAEALRDLEPVQLAAKLERAQERVGSLEAEHDLPGAPAGSFEDARDAAHRCAAKVQAAQSAEDQRQTALTAAEQALRVLQDRSIEQRTRLIGAEAEAQRSAQEIEQAREQASDDDSAKAVLAAQERVAATAAEHEAAAQALAEGDPGSARAMLQNARETQSRIAEDIKTREIERATTRTQLELAGHEGLSDRLAEARAMLEDLQREVCSENRRAAAVERLYAVLAEKREQAQHAYIGPFREKINAYARILYGQDVEVAVDHRSFELAARTMNGTSVPFDLLSGGAREQLAVLARLACGALVSQPDGDAPAGVPVIIDDALGYSDPGRLERLGAAFSVAGRDCQVIVLTCEPDRYRSIGGAQVVTLN